MATTTPNRPAPAGPRPGRSPDSQFEAERVRFRRAISLILMSTVLPGSAQLVAGSRQVGRVVLRAWLGMVGIGIVAWLIVPKSWLIGLAVRPWFLSFAQVVCVVVAVAWVTLLLDAWRLGHPPGLTRRHRLIAIGTSLALCVLVAYPPLKANRLAAAQHDLVAGIFATGAVKPTDGRVNVLVLGGDAGKGRIGLRPDSINLISLDEKTGKAIVFSLPRNLERARFPKGTPAAKAFPRGFRGEGKQSDYLLNAAWAYGLQHPQLFAGGDNPGAEATKQAVAGTLGLDVHYYLLVNLAGFKDLINALGGITLEVKEQVPVGQTGRVLKPGNQHLNGYEALWYARAREGSSDYARMARQRCVIDALVRQADPAAVVANFEQLAASAENLVETDIPQKALPGFVDLAWKTRSQPIVSLQFVPPLIKPSDPDFELMRGQAREAIEKSTKADAGAASGDVSDASQQSRPADSSAGPTDSKTEDESAQSLADICS